MQTNTVNKFWFFSEYLLKHFQNIITTTPEHQANTKTEKIEVTKTTIETSKSTSSLLNNTETTLDVCQTCQCLCTYKQTLLIPKTRAEEILEIK